MKMKNVLLLPKRTTPLSQQRRVQKQSLAAAQTDDTLDESEREDETRQVENPRIVKNIWTEPDIIICKALLFLFSVVIFFAVFSITWMWIYQAIPSVPPSILGLGGIEFIPFYFVVIVNFAMSINRQAKLFRLVWWIIELPGFLWATFLACIALYQLISCWDNTGPDFCQNQQFNEALLILLTLTLWVFMALVFIAFTSLFTRVKYLKS